MFQYFKKFLGGMVVLAMLAACGSQKKAAYKELLYMQGTLDTLPNKNFTVTEAKIQANDQLSIIVYSDNPEATAIYNQPQIQGAATKSSSAMATQVAGVSPTSGGYVVNKEGNIYMQTIGSIQAAGLTREQLATAIAGKLQTYLTHPYVDVRFQNLRVTVLGEVQKPGVISMPNEQVSLLELVGMAGDLTIYGKRENILVIREQNGKRAFGRVNLAQPDVFQSPYFYLHPNDVVYVEPSKKKQTAADQETMRRLTIITSIATVVSSLAILVTLFN